MRLRRSSPVHRARRQIGNALIFALMGLVVSGIAALGVMQSSRLRAKHDAGSGEASILDSLRNASNAAIFEQMLALQSSGPLAKNGIEVKPVIVGGTPVWRPTIDDLKGMGYLPPQWALTRSTLNNAPYTISFQLAPAGCAPADCSIDGQVLLGGAIRDGSAGGAYASDGAVIGPILTRLGVDSGVSLNSGPATITGYGNTWSIANPVAGRPAGVVAVRIGTLGAGWTQFVRIGDTRDPDLAGNLTVAGDTVFGAAGGLHTSSVNGSVQVKNAAGTACVVMQPNGQVDVRCDGRLNAGTGVFTDASGNVSTIGSIGLVTSGRVTANDGFATPNVSAFPSADPNAIEVKAGDMLVRNTAGNTLLKVASTGDVTAGRNLIAQADLAGKTLVLDSAATEGGTCSGAQLAALDVGGLAVCRNGTYSALVRYAAMNSPCDLTGRIAVDTVSGAQLICKGGRYGVLAELLQKKVFISSFSVKDG